MTDTIRVTLQANIGGRGPGDPLDLPPHRADALLASGYAVTASPEALLADVALAPVTPEDLLAGATPDEDTTDDAPVDAPEAPKSRRRAPTAPDAAEDGETAS